MENKNLSGSENLISTRKIWQNIRKYWWICILCVLAYGALVAVDVWRAYQSDVQAAVRDTYQASGMVYYPHSDEEEGRFFVTLCTTERVVDRVNEALTANGYSEYGADDSIEVNWIGNTFGLTLIGEGEERMACMMDSFLHFLLEEAQEVAGKEGSILNETSVRPCLVKSNGSVIVYEDASQRQATLSLGDIITWRRAMIAAAAFFAGALIIFVLIIFDEKIRTKEEIEDMLTAPCLGVLRTKNDQEVFRALTEGLCRKQNIGALTFITWKGTECLQEKLAKMGEAFSYEILEDICGNPEMMRKATAADHLVLAIRLNQDKKSALKQVLEDLELIGNDILGYLLLE